MSTVSDALNTLWTNLEDDELKIVQPIGDNYFTAIEANPSPENVVAQSAQLEVAVVAALPNIEAAAAKDVATALKTLMDLEVASLTSTSTASVAPVAASPSAAS
jgi:hypothetical protein